MIDNRALEGGRICALNGFFMHSLRDTMNTNMRRKNIAFYKATFRGVLDNGLLIVRRCGRSSEKFREEVPPLFIVASTFNFIRRQSQKK